MPAVISNADSFSLSAMFLSISELKLITVIKSSKRFVSNILGSYSTTSPPYPNSKYKAGSTNHSLGFT
jgi:hypothetical protein